MDNQKLAEKIVNTLLYPKGTTSHAEWANRFNQVSMVKKLLINRNLHYVLAAIYARMETN
jgi:hypothetical protein